jgi:hypothetical protein
MKQNNQSRDKYKNKRKHKNKSKKNTHKIDTNFYGSHLIPITPIINYMKDNFDTYLTHLKQVETENKYVIYLDDVFQTNNIFHPTGQIYNLKTEINSNPDMPLDKLIAYAFYMKTKDAFITKDNNPTTNSTYLETLKYQMGKDISRDNRTIKYYNSTYNKNDANGKKDTTKFDQTTYESSYFSNLPNNFLIADKFYKLIIKYYSDKVNRQVDYNIINKIALLSCQNIFNLITDLITIKLNDILSPETNTVFRPTKNIVITFTKEEQTMELNFQSKLIISKNGMLNPEYPCGNLIFTLFVDLKNNKFKFNNFQISYDLDKCDESTENNEVNNETDNPLNSKMNLKYAMPVALGIGGIISTPFILGALGGKNNKKKIPVKKIKTRKLRNKT